MNYAGQRSALVAGIQREDDRFLQSY